MKSRVTFEIVGSVHVLNSASYTGTDIYPEVADGKLRSLALKIEHDVDLLPNDVVQQAREKLRNFLSLIGLRIGFVPELEAAHIQHTNTDGETKVTGMMSITSNAYFARELQDFPSEELLKKLERDSKLQRQVDHLNAARSSEVIVNRINWGYIVLEGEFDRGNCPACWENFKHLRDAVSHFKLDNPKLKAYFIKEINAEIPDLRNNDHLDFLRKQAEEMLKEASKIVEVGLSKK